MTITYYLRKPGTQYFSIERVFEAVRQALPPALQVRVVYSRFRRGIFGRIYNLLEAATRQSELNHITGDINYLALALNRKTTVLTIHDCGTLHRLTGWKREFNRLLWFEWPSRRAAVVTTISEATKADLLLNTSCAASRITVVPDPVPAGFQPSPKAFCAARPRILQVGTFYNKNLENVARALIGISCHLTIIGALSAAQTAILTSCGIEYDALADLTPEQVLDRYRNCDLLVFCSTSEGFGMPIVEANSVGRAVVTSDAEPMRSVAAGAACLVNPHDPADIRAGIQRVVSDSEYRDDLIRRGFINAQRFQASQIATQYFEIYRNVFESAHTMH